MRGMVETRVQFVHRSSRGLEGCVHSPVHVREVIATDSSCELNGARMTVDPPRLRILQDLKIGALELHRDLIGREQVGGKKGNEKYVMYYKPVATRQEEP